MKRTRLTMLLLAFVGALGACGSPGISEQTTTPDPEGASEAPDTTLVAETPAPAVVEPETPTQPPAPAAPTYLHGKWVWFELNTSDPDAAAKFYTELLGWKVESKEVNATKYSAIMNGAKELAMIQALPEDAKTKKISPSWLGYISVANVDAAVTAATSARATVTVPAMDMPEVGRFAVLADPWGASFGVVTSSQGDMPDGMPGAGDFIWIEHLAKDAKKAVEAQTFYAAVAGYETKSMKVGKMDYGIGVSGGVDRVGFMKANKPAWAGKFVTYFVVADVDSTVKLATKLKGKVLSKAQDVPGVGRFAMLADPQGAVFAVMAPAPMPSEGSGVATPEE